MPNWQRMALALALLAGLAGCAEQAKESPGGDARQIETEGLADRAEAPPAPGAPAQKAAAEAATNRQEPPAAALNRQIIRRASLTVQVEQVRPAIERVQALAERYGGFVSDSSLMATEGVPPQASLTLRVPARRFDEVLGALGDVGTVRQRTVSSEDVTLEYVDTTSRIRNLQKQEEQLLKLLNRAGKLSEVLEVERELARVRGEIEQAQGRLRHLSALVDLATIQLALTEQVQVANASPWQLPAVWENAWKNAQRRLAGAVGDLLEGAVWLVGYVLPLVVPALALFLLVGWGLRKWLVDRQKATDARTFRRVWAACGLALLCLAFPPLIGFVVLVGLVLLVAWAAAGLWRRFSRRGEA